MSGDEGGMSEETTIGDEAVVYDGKDIAVRAKLTPGVAFAVVVFSARNGHGRVNTTPARDLRGPGEEFMTKAGIPALFFTARWNHWWQSPEMFEAIEVIRSRGLLSGFSHVSTYGMSMGGYGALMYSAALGADRAIAVAPQYSLDSNVVAFETRWPEDRARLRFIYDDMDKGLIKSGEVIVMFDPFFPHDSAHISLLRRHRRLTELPVSFATHTVARAINDMGILSKSMAELLRGELNSRELQRRIRENRRKSPLILANFAHKIRRRDLGQATRLARAAVDAMEARFVRLPEYYRQDDTGADATRIAGQLARNLIDSGEPAEAIEVMDRWRPRLSDTGPTFDPLVARAMHALGDEAGALATIEGVIATARGSDLVNALLLGIQFLEKSNDVGAIKRFGSAYAERILQDENAATRFGLLLLRNKDEAAARRFFADCADGRNSPRRAAFVKRRVLGLARAGDLPGATALLDRLLPGERFCKDREEIRAALSKESGDVGEGRVATRPRSVVRPLVDRRADAELERKARDAYAAGNCGEALAALDQVLPHQRDKAGLWVLKARVLISLSDMEGAAEAAREAEKLGPSSGIVRALFKRLDLIFSRTG